MRYPHDAPKGPRGAATIRLGFSVKLRGPKHNKLQQEHLRLWRKTSRIFLLALKVSEQLPKCTMGVGLFDAGFHSPRLPEVPPTTYKSI